MSDTPSTYAHPEVLVNTDWLAAHHPRPKDEWVKLFKQTFRFTGGEIVNEFLMSLGYLPGAHRPDCPVALQIAKLNPPWMQKAP